MLNNTNVIRLGSNSQTVNFNAPCTGILQRSHSKSKFIQFHMNSEIANRLFPENGSASTIELKPKEDYYRDRDPKSVTILQCMLFGNNMYLVEYVFDTDLIEEKQEQ